MAAGSLSSEATQLGLQLTRPRCELSCGSEKVVERCFPQRSSRLSGQSKFRQNRRIRVWHGRQPPQMVLWEMKKRGSRRGGRLATRQHLLIQSINGVAKRYDCQGSRHSDRNPCVPGDASTPPSFVRLHRKRRNARRISRRIPLGVSQDGRRRPRTGARTVVKGPRHGPLIALVMRILLDECVNQRLRNYLPGDTCQSAQYAGLGGLKNSELLAAASSPDLMFCSRWTAVFNTSRI